MKRTNSILTLANGRGIDLLGPKASDIDFDVIAEHLAKENRYNGATKGQVYSVAEHSVRGTRAILAQTSDHTLAAYFLLHDGHEAFLGDDTTPKKRAIGEIAHEAFGVLAASITDAFELLTHRFDSAIHEAAGLVWPPSADIAAQVKHWDLRMFVTEWRDLMGNQPHPDWKPYADIEPLTQQIIPWTTWSGSAEAFKKQCRALLPALQSARGGFV